jgi:hypothetical protein
VGSFTALLAVVVSLFIASAGPAHAADLYLCNSDRTQYPPENLLTIRTPGGDDVRVTIDLCVGRVEKPSQRGSVGYTSWTGHSGRKRFNSFKVTVRLEHADGVVISKTCDLTKLINDLQNSPDRNRCGPIWHSTATRGKWTTDGVVHYDIYGDGKGTYTWNLRGTPELA